MGIHGLTSFIDNNPHLLKDHQLHDCRVIIDGNNFFHFLYFYCHVRFQFGGDYDVYKKKIAMIFSLFKSCNIEPYVVFDGAYTVDGKKHRTTISRARDRIYAAQRIVNGHRGTLIPCLAQTTFRQTLDRLGIQHVTCDFEADNQIVTLANLWNSPVISNDSDFYIFDLKAGFIPLDYMDFRLSRMPADDESEAYNFLAVQFYHVDRFIGCFKSLNRSVLPLFATMLGNDYVEAAAFEKFYNKQTPKVATRRYSASKKHVKIVSVLYWLEEKGNLEEVLPEVLTFIKAERRQRVEKLLTDSIKGYVETEEFESFSLKEYFEGNRDAALDRTDTVKSCEGSELPVWFLRSIRCGELPVFLLNAVLLQRVILHTQVESVKLSASFLISATLRQVIYGILFDTDDTDTPQDSKDESAVSSEDFPPLTTPDSTACAVAVEEYTRHNMELRKISVIPTKCLPKYGNLPVLEAVPELSLSNKQAIITEALRSSEEFVSKFEPSLQLFMMCLVFWVRNASPSLTLHHLRGVLLSVILLHVHKEIKEREDKILDLETGKDCVSKDEDSTTVSESSNTDSIANPFSSAAPSTLSVGGCSETKCVSVSSVCQSLSSKVLQKVRENLRKYYRDPAGVNSKNPPDHPAFHAIAQLNACLLDSIHLNYLLLCPFSAPQPAVLINGSFIYTMIQEQQNRTNPDLFLQEMLVKGSALVALFDSLCSVMVGEVGDTVFTEQRMQGKKCCKSARKKKKRTMADRGGEREGVDVTSDAGRSEEKMAAACDLSNRFGALLLEEFDE